MSIENTKRRKSNIGPIAEQFTKHVGDLQYQHKANEAVQKAIVNLGTPFLVRVLVFLAGQILNGTIKLSTEEKKLGFAKLC